jgi:hypothetical protein
MRSTLPAFGKIFNFVMSGLNLGGYVDYNAGKAT